MDPTSNSTLNSNPAPAPETAPGSISAAPALAQSETSAQPSVPVVSEQPAAAQLPVNPIVTPSNPAPANPVYQPSNVGVAATDPIMVPEPAPAPDPVEEELKAPMKAAGPVPGSIGSSVSGPEVPEPADVSAASVENSFAAPADNTPSVSFTDPAAQLEAANAAQAPTKLAKKKTSKGALIALIMVAVMIVIALGAVLAIQIGLF